MSKAYLVTYKGRPAENGYGKWRVYTDREWAAFYLRQVNSQDDFAILEFDLPEHDDATMRLWLEEEHAECIRTIARRAEIAAYQEQHRSEPMVKSKRQQKRDEQARRDARRFTFTPPDNFTVAGYDVIVQGKPRLDYHLRVLLQNDQMVVKFDRMTDAEKADVEIQRRAI